MRKAIAVFALLAVLALAPGCGEGDGCLSRADVEHEVNELAMGFETSSAEVEDKQREIEDIRGRECARN